MTSALSHPRAVSLLGESLATSSYACRHAAEHQILYPRQEMMEQIVSVFRKTGRSVPIFCDKHLSYSWTKAKQMAGWAQELKIPFMAGSSLPVTWRRPELELRQIRFTCSGQVHSVSPRRLLYGSTDRFICPRFGPIWVRSDSRAWTRLMMKRCLRKLGAGRSKCVLMKRKRLNARIGAVARP